MMHSIAFSLTDLLLKAIVFSERRFNGCYVFHSSRWMLACPFSGLLRSLLWYWKH